MTISEAREIIKTPKFGDQCVLENTQNGKETNED